MRGLFGRRLSRLVALGAVLVIAPLVTGCEETWNSIYRNEAFKAEKGPGVITVDAKQRNVFVMPVARAPGQANDENAASAYRLCAEPPPDVLTALSTSASGELGVDAMKSGDVNAKLKAAIAASESVAAIQRTQTVNILRELMYRTCERYLNGASDSEELAIQAARDQRTIVSVLAIEQLTDAAKPQNVIIAGGGTAAGLGSAEDARKEASDDSVALTDEQQTLQSKKDAYAKLNGEAKTCDDLLKETDKTKVAADQQAQWTTCKAANDAVTLETGKVAEAKAKLDSAERIASAAGDSTASTAPVVVTASGSTSGGAAQDLAAVAGVVRDIVNDTFNTDETQLACVAIIRSVSDTPQNKDLRDECLHYLTQRTSLDSLKAALVSIELQQAVSDHMKNNRVSAEDRAQRLREYLMASGDPAKTWAALVKAGLPRITRDRQTALLKPQTVDDILAAFMTLSPDFQADIINQMPK